MTIVLAYIAAAAASIAGCFAFWAWLRLGKSVWWIAPGVGSLVLFADFLTLVDASAAERACAAYGGVYIASSTAHGFNTPESEQGGMRPLILRGSAVHK